MYIYYTRTSSATRAQYVDRPSHGTRDPEEVVLVPRL